MACRSPRHIDPANAAGIWPPRSSVTAITAGIAVTVPEAAVVAQRMVSSGQMVADLDPLVDLIDPRSIAVNASVPAADLALIRLGMAASVTSPVSPGETYPARIAALAPAFDQGGAAASAASIGRR